jgi:hypothetical protein
VKGEAGRWSEAGDWIWDRGTESVGRMRLALVEREKCGESLVGVGSWEGTVGPVTVVQIVMAAWETGRCQDEEVCYSVADTEYARECCD